MVCVDGRSIVPPIASCARRWLLDAVHVELSERDPPAAEWFCGRYLRPQRLKICSVDILDDARDGEVVDAARRFIFWLPFQHSIRNFGSEQVMP